MTAPPTGSDRVGDLVGFGLALARPAVAPGHDPRRAGVDAEVAQRDHRRDLELVVRAREVRPDVFVAVGDLRLRAGAARDQVTEVEPVRASTTATARSSQIAR